MSTAQRIRLYHVTTLKNALVIALSGFEDRVGGYGTDTVYRGVWLSDRPLDANEGVSGDTVIAVDLDLSESEFEKYEWRENGKPYREWLIPKEIIEKRGNISLPKYNAPA